MDNEIISIKMKITLAKEFSSGWHTNITRWRRLYDFDHYDVQPKDGETQYQDPTYTNTVDLAVGITLANTVAWKATPWLVTGEDAAKVSSTVEKFLAGVIAINSDHNEYDVVYELLLNFARDGGAVLYSVWDEELAAEVLETKKLYNPETGTEESYPCYTEIPTLMQVIDPLSIHVLPGSSRRWSVIVRTEDTTVYDVYDRFKVIPESVKHLEDNTEMMLREKGTLADYWENALEDGKRVVKHAVLFNNDVIVQPIIMEKYAELPYTVAFYKPTDRMNSKKWSSILTPLISSISMEERAINRRQRQIDLFSALSLVTKTAHGRKVDADPSLGSVINLDTTEDIGFPRWDGNPPDVDRQIDLFRSRIQQSGFTDLFYGSGASDSGFALSQQTDQNRIRLTQPITHFEKLLGWWAKKAIQITQTNAKPGSKIYVYGKVKDHEFIDAVNVDMLSGTHIVCKVQPEFPNEKVRNHAMASQMRGLLPDRTIIEDYLKYQQPDEQIDMAQVEAVLKDQTVMQYMVMSKLIENANQGDEAASLILDAIQNGTLPGRVGRPNEPNAPEQGRGIQTVPAKQPGEATPNMQGGV